jgi:hypothetical protein
VREVSKFIDDEESECFEYRNLCGNGIIDPGEECDSGLPFGSLCCTSDCKLREGCECEDRNGRCCKDCKISPLGKVCREVSKNINERECDVEDVCDGVSYECKNIYRKDESLCGKGVCMKGVCQSRELMCERVGKRYSDACEGSRGCNLMCSDMDDICSGIGVLFLGEKSPIALPDNLPCKQEGSSGICVKGKCVVKKSYKYFYSMVFSLIFVFLSLIIILAFLP